jgi:hypothetical protein
MRRLKTETGNPGRHGGSRQKPWSSCWNRSGRYWPAARRSLLVLSWANWWRRSSASSRPNCAPEQRQMMIELVDDLVPVLVEEMIEQGVLPAEWRETKLQ